MKKKKIEKTILHKTKFLNDSNKTKKILFNVFDSLKKKGYNAVMQISGYLISNDPAYISSYKNARLKIQEIDRYKIIEELVIFYIKNKKKI